MNICANAIWYCPFLKASSSYSKQIQKRELNPSPANSLGAVFSSTSVDCNREIVQPLPGKITCVPWCWASPLLPTRSTDGSRRRPREAAAAAPAPAARDGLPVRRHHHGEGRGVPGPPQRPGGLQQVLLLAGREGSGGHHPRPGEGQPLRSGEAAGVHLHRTDEPQQVGQTHWHPIMFWRWNYESFLFLTTTTLDCCACQYEAGGRAASSRVPGNARGHQVHGGALPLVRAERSFPVRSGQRDGPLPAQSHLGSQRRLAPPTVHRLAGGDRKSVV